MILTIIIGIVVIFFGVLAWSVCAISAISDRQMDEYYKNLNNNHKG